MAVDLDYDSVRFLESFGLVTAKSFKGSANNLGR